MALRRYFIDNNVNIIIFLLKVDFATFFHNYRKPINVNLSAKPDTNLRVLLETEKDEAYKYEEKGSKIFSWIYTN